MASIDDPPKLMSGAVTPVIGMIPTFIPTFTKSWNSSITVMPPASSAPNRFFAMVRMWSARHISSAYNESTSAAPANP